MALFLMNPGVQPLGMFDAVDAELTTFKGGEICTLAANVAWMSSTDLAAADANDGYLGTSPKYRPAVTKASLDNNSGPLFLADDGTSGYGTLLGSVVGGTVGQLTTGAVLGPHTATGSGKITLWDKQGLYAASLDAVDTAADGLVASNNALTVGKSLTYTPAGLLTPVGSAAAGSNTKVVAKLVEFSTNLSLVTTPSFLTAPLSGPGGKAMSFTRVVFWYAGAL